MRDLIQLERDAYNEERLKEEEDLDKLQKQHETKLKLLKNRMLMMIPNQGTEQLTIDEVVKKVIDTFQQLNASKRDVLREQNTNQYIDNRLSNEYNSAKISPMKNTIAFTRNNESNY